VSEREAVGSPASAAVAPPVVAPPPGHPRFPLFDSLRAIAALGVMVAHVGFFAGAIQHASYGSLVANLNAGVTLFFVISGFLLYRPFVAADFEGRRRPRVRDYARRRVLRIVPAYWVALTVLAIYPGLVGVFTGRWPFFYFFGQIYGPGLTPVEGLAVAWSLDVEVSFYLLLPFYAWAVSRFAGRFQPSRRLAVELGVLGVLAAASVGLRVWDLEGGGSRLQVTLLTTFLWFALGMSLAVTSAAFRSRPVRPPAVRFVERRPGLCWLAAAAVYVMLAVLVNTDSAQQEVAYSNEQWLLQHLLAGAVAFLLVLPAVFGDGRSGLPRAILAVPVLGWLGLVSYGIFLWHGGVLLMWVEEGALGWSEGSRFMLLTALTFAGTVVCAALSYYVVERPFLRLKDRRAGRPSRSTPPLEASGRGRSDAPPQPSAARAKS
jgi:peptidoglycan/LPS O-acetylase OafA/YrhL